jgi:O-antigen/teichoic acid export membrane protein
MNTSSRLRAIKNVLASWFGLGTTMVVGFFLTPFILHQLGNTAYGLWVLLTAFTGYYGLLDLGIRNAIVRYVARYPSAGDTVELSRLVSTSFFSYSATALVLVVITGVTAWQMETWFDISPEWRSIARLLLLIAGIGSAIGMPLSLFGGVLEGLHRFSWVGAVQAAVTLARAGLLVYLLKNGGGIIALAVVTVAANLASSVIYAAVVFRLCPNLRITASLASKTTFKGLASFGLITFWIAVAQVLRFQFDSMVIAGFLSLQAVTFFSISSKLVSYLSDGVQAMAQIFTPISSALDASGDNEGLRRVLLLSNRYSAFLVFPLAVVLLFCGSAILRVWVGPMYESSYTVLVILTIPTALYLAQAGSPKVLYGMARHRTLAVALLAEGIANLILSMVLAKPFGIEGVAIGTAIPMAATSLLFLPRHLCKLLDLGIGRFFREAYLYPTFCVAPLSAALWALDRWIRPETWGSLLLELSMGGLIYGTALLIYFHRVERPAAARRAQEAVAVRIPLEGRN